MSAPVRPDMPQIFAANDATWAPAALHRHGPWLVRQGQGGGQRVSAATAEGPVTDADIPQMEAAQHALGQRPLVMIRPGDEALDAALAARGYQIVDPVMFRMASVHGFPALAPVRAFAHWPPLALTADIWDQGEIGAARRAVMERVTGPRAAIIGRTSEKLNRAAGTGFVAVAKDIAMVHAMYVLPELRRQGAADQMLRAAAQFGRENGADWIALAVTRANEGANALYASLGLEVVGHYHYRRL